MKPNSTYITSLSFRGIEKLTPPEIESLRAALADVLKARDRTRGTWSHFVVRIPECKR